MPENEAVAGTPDHTIEAADISPDEKTLITGSLGGTLVEWDRETGERRRVLHASMRGSSILSVRFSPNGKYFAVGAANGYVVLWNAPSRGEIFGWTASDAGIVALDISPDRKWLATGSLEEFGKTLRVWSFRERHPDVRQAFCGEHHILGVWTVCFSPNGRLVAAGGWSMSGYNAPEIFDVRSGRQVGALYWDITRALRFSPNGKLILTGGDFGEVKLWQVRSREIIWEVKAHGDSVRDVGFSPDGKRFFSASRSEGVKIWETKDEGALLREYAIGRVVACRFAKDGRTLLAASAAKGSDRPTVHRLTLAA